MGSRMVVLVICMAHQLLAQSEKEWRWEDMATQLDASQLEKIDLENHKLIDLNKSKINDWRSLGVFTTHEIHSIIKFLETYRPLNSVYQLQMIENIPVSKWNSIHHLLTITGNSLNVNKTQGYIMSLFDFNENGEYRQQHRFKWTGKQLKTGFLMENDKGEILRWNPVNHQYGYDHYSFFMEYKSQGVLNRMILGDYVLNLGEGLVFGNGFGVSKGMETIASVKNRGVALRPYTSSSEYGNFRGVATEWNLSKNIKLIQIISKVGKDATLNERGEFSSFNESGMHKTTIERHKKWNITEQTFGAAMISTFSKGHLGFTGIFTRYNRIYWPTAQLRNIYKVQGRNRTKISVFGDITFGNTWVFSELATNLNDLAITFGTIQPLTKFFDMAILCRSFGPAYESYWGNGFSERSGITNEKGVYFGFSGKWSKSWRWSTYLDLFSSPWLNYQINTTSNGTDWLGSLQWNANKNTRVVVKVRNKRKEKTLVGEDHRVGKVVIHSKWNYWLHFQFKLSPKLEFRQRIQGNSVILPGMKSEGNLYSMELINEWKNTSISMRLMNFTTDSFENREYIYERDVLYSFSIPFYYRHGWRFYYLQNLKFKNFTFWLKYSTKIRSPSLDEMNNLISENKNSELKIQLQYKF